MLCLYRNKYTGEKFIFDAVRLLRYSIEDPILDGSSYYDLQKNKVKSPYRREGVHINSEELMVVTKNNTLWVWYNWYTYKIEFDEAVYLNGKLICGIIDMMYRNLYIEYMYWSRNSNFNIGIGLKNGRLRISSDGYLYYNHERYRGVYESSIAFKTSL